MKRLIALACIAIAAVALATETTDPLWSARYWANQYGVEFADVTLSPSGSSWAIVTNGVDSGETTADVDQADALAYAKQPHTNLERAWTNYITQAGGAFPVGENSYWVLSTSLTDRVNQALGTNDAVTAARLTLIADNLEGLMIKIPENRRFEIDP